MAFRAEIKDPLDLQPRKAVGVKLPFSSDSVFTSTFTSKEAIKTNLINFFLTSKGERFLNPTFGSEIKNMLFENITPDTLRLLDSSIRQELKIFFPRVEPIQINSSTDPDTNVIQFNISYTIKQTNIEDEVVINFEQ